MKTTKHYIVRTEGMNGHYSQSGYSKYNKRYAFRHANDYPEGFEVYGIEQAKEHIKELKASIYEGKQHLKNEVFEIVEVTTIEKLIPIE